jgi:hypothetical protein
VNALTADSLHAWYEELGVASIGPVAEARPDVGSVLGQLFVLSVDAKGHLAALETPAFPASLEGRPHLARGRVGDHIPRCRAKHR